MNLTGVTVLENGPGGAVLAGAPSDLSRVCAALGFTNPCRNGRVYLTAAKMRQLGLGDSVGTDPGWRMKSKAQLRAEGKAT